VPDVDDDSKTEQPTAKRVRDERKKGHVPRSAEIDIAFFLFFFLIILQFGGKPIVHVLKTSFEFCLNNLSFEITFTNAQHLYLRFFYYFWLILLPIGFIFILGGFISMIVQVGWLVTWDNLKLKFDIFKLDGLKQIFSMEGLKKLVIDLVKLAVLTLITWLVVRKFIFDMLGLVNLEVIPIYLFLVKLVIRLLLALLLFYLFFAIMDYVWTKINFTKKIKMTKSEVKDEYKQLEGDPQVKRKILQLMMEESMKRMMQEVPKADVIITNPIHLAIAIKYDQSVGDAPIAVAKGKRLVAERIKEIARENDIPIVEDKPLARLLYKHCKIGKPIDVQFYMAVAEILANVYKMKNRNNH